MKKLLKAQKIGTFDPTKVSIWNAPQSYYPASDRQNAPSRQLSVEEIAKQKAAAEEAMRLKKLYEQQELARRKKAIAASIEARDKELTAENFATETGAIGEKLRFFPDDPDSFIDEHINPFKMVGDMASGLGRIPLNIKQGDYGKAAFNLAVPVTTGLLGGIGARSTGQFINNIFNPAAGLIDPTAKWTRELIEGSIAAGKPKLPEFVKTLRAEPKGFDPSKVEPHPSLNPTQQGYTGGWIQAASAKNPTAFDEMVAYLSGPEKKADGPMQLLTGELPWSKAKKLVGASLPYDAKIMSFGPGVYGTLENAFKNRAISAREYVLLKNYNYQTSRIKASPNLKAAMDQTISRLRPIPHLYNPNELVDTSIAAQLRKSPAVVGDSDIALKEVEKLKDEASSGIFKKPVDRALRNNTSTFVVDTEASYAQKNGGMIKRKDGSYSRRGLWDNIRDNAGSGKKPTAEMLRQEKKIRNEEKEYGGSLPTSTLGVPYQDKEYMYQEGGNTDYNLNRAKELGYTADEAGHLPSVDYTTGMWLKSKKHPTAFLEYLEAILNPELQNQQVVVNPEGYFGNEQLQYVPKKETGGTNPPIIVRDPKDPRLQAYQDSLILHKISYKGKEAIENLSPLEAIKWVDKYGPATSKLIEEYKTKLFQNPIINDWSPNSPMVTIQPEGTAKSKFAGMNLAYATYYKKPEQPYILEKKIKDVDNKKNVKSNNILKKNKEQNIYKIPSRVITEIPYNPLEREFVHLDIPMQKPERNPPQKFYYGKDEKQEKRRLAGKPYTAVNSSGAEIYIASGDTRLNSDPENTIGYNRGRVYVEGDRIEDFEPTRDTQNNPISKKQTGGNIYDKETDNLLAQIASMIADGEDPDMVAGSLVNNGYSEEVVDSLVEEAIDRLTELGDYEEEDINQLEDIKVLREGGIPDRYKNQGFTKVGAKRKSNRPGKKWMVLAKKGNKYKIVHGGYKGMKDYTQHGSEERRERFWDRMGGKNSSKAKDPFSPLYWHKRFGTWQDGGKTPIEDPEGQRKYPGKTTRIPSNRITMEGINYPVLAIGDNGKANLMLPGEEYLYLGVNYVDEVPFSK